MNTVIELHDSCVAGVTSSEGSVIVQIRPAYLHRSEGRPGFDPGSGWVQDLDLIVSDAVLESSFTEMPRELVHGTLSVGNEVFDNLIPFPLDVQGALRFCAIGLDEERLAIQGTRATAVLVAKACFIEQFPGTE
jgi:hypothetical protein